jgi:hypothetical protein
VDFDNHELLLKSVSKRRMQTLQSSIFPTFFIGEAIHFPRDEVHPAHGAEVEKAARAAAAARKSPT